jgi:hypothetical protein
VLFSVISVVLCVKNDGGALSLLRSPDLCGKDDDGYSASSTPILATYFGTPPIGVV